MQQINGSEFRPEEIVTLRHFDKKTGQWVDSPFPTVGGRLRLAHLHNESLDISTEIIQYDGNVAVVKAVVTTQKGCFTGFGMASVERDSKIAPALLELAETRSISRAMRWAGYGMEYCSVEEISHLDQEENFSAPPANQSINEAEQSIYCPRNPVSMQPTRDGTYRASNGTARSNGNQDQAGNNGNGRLTQKQHGLLMRLAEDRGLSRSQLDQMSKERFGCVVSFISKGDASSFIGEMTSN